MFPFGGILGTNISRSAPSLTSAQNVSTGGGTTTVRGSFVSDSTGTTRLWILNSGVLTPLVVTYVNATTMIAAIPAESAGTYDMVATNPDGQSAFSRGLLTVTATSDPQTILGSSLLLWYKADVGVTTSSGVVTQWADQSGNGYHLTASGTARPTYNAASSNGFNAKPTITFDGSANQLSNSGAGPSLGSNTVFVYVVMRLIGAAASKNYFVLSGSGLGAAFSCSTDSGALLCMRNLSSTVAIATVSTNPSGASGIYGALVGTASTAETAYINVANLSEVTGTSGNGAQPNNAAIGPAYLGANNGSGFAACEVAEIIVANRKPNSSELLALYQHLNFKYSLDTALSFVAATDVLASTGTQARIGGGGFNSSTSVQVTISGTDTAVTTTYNNAGCVSLSSIPSLSAGSYRVKITNANSGAELVVDNALTATATKKIDTILQRKAILWNRMDKVTLNSTKVSACTDLMRLGNYFQQPTAANQPTYNSSNSNVSNQPTAQFTGSPVEMLTASNVQLDAGDGSNVVFFVVVRQPTASGTQYLISWFDAVRINSSGVPLALSTTGSAATFGSSIAGSKSLVMGEALAGADSSHKNLAVNANYGTEVDNNAVTGGNALTLNRVAVMGSSSGANYLSGDIAEIVICDQSLTTGESADVKTYLQGRYP